jgi:dipeptidase E
MVQSGFDQAIRSLFAKDEVVYGGYSASICVLTPDLHGIELVDNPNVVPKGYDSEVIWEGMGLVDFAIVPHYRSDHPESAAIEKVVDYFKKHNIPYKALHDGQVILANNYEVKVV